MQVEVRGTTGAVRMVTVLVVVLSVMVSLVSLVLLLVREEDPVKKLKRSMVKGKFSVLVYQVGECCLDVSFYPASMLSPLCSSDESFSDRCDVVR